MCTTNWESPPAGPRSHGPCARAWRTEEANTRNNIQERPTYRRDMWTVLLCNSRRSCQVNVVYSLRQHGTSYFLFFVFCTRRAQKTKNNEDKEPLCRPS